jgi:hypothetical protein
MKNSFFCIIFLFGFILATVTNQSKVLCEEGLMHPAFGNLRALAMPLGINASRHLA